MEMENGSSGSDKNSSKEIRDIWGFLANIDWSEKWLIALVIWHIIMFVITGITRHRTNIQFVIFLCFLIMVYFSEDINKFAATHWRQFSKHQYFDSQGVFISIVFSMPILMNSLIIVVNLVWQSNQTLIHVKRKELLQRISPKKKQ